MEHSQLAHIYMYIYIYIYTNKHEQRIHETPEHMKPHMQKKHTHINNNTNTRLEILNS